MEWLKKIRTKESFLILIAFFFSLELLNIGFENSLDSYFSVSSQNDSTSYLFYFFQSLVYGIHFYTGGWLLIILATIFYFTLKPQKIIFFSKFQKVGILFFIALYLIVHSSIFSSDNSLLIGEGLKKFLEVSIGFTGLVILLVVLNGLLVYTLLLKNSLFQNKIKDFQSKLNWKNLLPTEPVTQTNRTINQHQFQPPKVEVTAFDYGNHEKVEKIEEKFNEAESKEILDEEEPVHVVANTLTTKVKKELKSDEENKRLLQEYISESTSQLENSSPDSQYFQSIKKILEEKLAEFKIIGTIINVMKGPVVDTFELELGAGVKVSRVGSASEDLSLALSGAPIRIVFPLKGKATVGIEVPRSPREIIYLTELLKTKEFTNNRHRIPLVLGKNAFGEPVVEDLAAMPHMLVAGATGAGKSVFINSVLVSLLIRLDHTKLKLILIDPKQLELALYANLKHLLLPVMTTPSLASCALLWATEEMERRYSLMSQKGVRNIDGYNAKVTSSDFLPYIVVIIDEFADLILSKHGKDIEANICRLAAKARASGIHLILATQRPSVDVITGLIKSNFPTRVSFRVTSAIDSRTILNAIGAENLLGMGDMLYKTGVETTRVHSPYIHENEIDKIVSYLSTDESSFDSEALEFIEEKENEINGSNLSKNGEGTDLSTSSSAEDPLLEQAIEIVMQYKAASASMLQRRLKIGYNRAANLVETLEQKGIVGPQQGAKPRRVIVQELGEE